MAGELSDECLKHGVGRLGWEDGRLYAGGFVNGRMVGLGMLIDAENSIFVGRFRDGEQDGYGGYYSRESVFIGMWRSGERHGEGVEQEEQMGEVKWKAVVKYEHGELVHLDDFSQGKRAWRSPQPGKSSKQTTRDTRCTWGGTLRTSGMGEKRRDGGGRRMEAVREWRREEEKERREEGGVRSWQDLADGADPSH
eukprot:747642-Hanusia_phi.AAC.5